MKGKPPSLYKYICRRLVSYHVHSVECCAMNCWNTVSVFPIVFLSPSRFFVFSFPPRLYHTFFLLLRLSHPPHSPSHLPRLSSRSQRARSFSYLLSPSSYLPSQSSANRFSFLLLFFYFFFVFFCIAQRSTFSALRSYLSTYRCITVLLSPHIHIRTLTRWAFSPTRW